MIETDGERVRESGKSVRAARHEDDMYECVCVCCIEVCNYVFSFHIHDIYTIWPILCFGWSLGIALFLYLCIVMFYFFVGYSWVEWSLDWDAELFDIFNHFYSYVGWVWFIFDLIGVSNLVDLICWSDLSARKLFVLNRNTCKKSLLSCKRKKNWEFCLELHRYVRDKYN